MLAPADHLAPSAAPGDAARALDVVGAGETPGRGKTSLEVLPELEIFLRPDHVHDHLRDGRGSRQAGRFDAEEVDPTRERGAFLDDEIGELGPDARVGMNERESGQVRDERDGLGLEPGRDGGRRGRVPSVIDGLTARAEEDVAFHGRREVDAEEGIVPRRHGIDRHPENGTRLFVGNEVFPAKRADAGRGDAREGSDVLGEQARGINDPARRELPLRRGQGKTPPRTATPVTPASRTITAPFCRADSARAMVSS